MFSILQRSTVIVSAAAMVFLATPTPAARTAELPTPTAELSLDDVIEIALARSPRLRIVERGVEAAERGTDVAHGAFFPFVDVFGDYQYSGFGSRSGTRLLANIGRMPTLGPNVSGNQPKPGVAFGTREFDQNLAAAGVRLSYPLYAGGRVVANFEASRLTVALAREELQQTKDDLIFNLSSTYYGILRLQKSIKATEASVRALEEAQRVIKQLVEVGRVPRADLLKVNTRLAAVRVDLIRVKNEEAVSFGVLNSLMGIEDVTQPLRLKGPLQPAPQVFDLRQSIARALERRPEYRGRQQEVAIQEQKVRIAQGARLPSVNLRVQYGAGAPVSRAFPLVDDFVAGVNVSVPLFAGGALQARVAEELAALGRAQAAVERSKLQVAQEVQAAYLSVVEAQERIKAAEVALQDAREALRIEQLKTEVGRGIIEDLLDAQAAELQAENSYFRAVADSLTAVAGLRKAIGIVR